MWHKAPLPAPPNLRGFAGYWLAILSIAVGFSATALADVTLQSTNTETGTWSSNPLLAISGATPLWGSTTSPDMLLKSQTPKSLVSLDTRVDENIFNQSAFNSTDLHTIAIGSTQNQRWTAQIQQQTDYDTTRTAELTDFGLTNIIARRTAFTAAPQITYGANPRDSLILSGIVNVTHYDHPEFVNYENFSAITTFKRQIDPLNAGLIFMQAQHYQTLAGPQNNIDSWGPAIGWQRTLTQRLLASASIGAQASRQFQAGAPSVPWTWQYVFNTGLEFHGQRDTITLNASRAQYPYGNGTESLQTNFAIGESRALTPLFSANLSGTYLTAAYQTDVINGLKSIYGGSAGISYHATNRLDLTATYQYRGEALTENNAQIHDSSVLLSLAYHPKLWTLAP